MNLLGLAYTVPSVAVLAINRDLCRVHLYEPGALASLALFLKSDDKRAPVVLVKSLNELKNIIKSEEIPKATVILFETARILNLIKGIRILDVDSNGDRQYVNHGDLNLAITTGTSRVVDIAEALHSEKGITNDIHFAELVSVITRHYNSNGLDPNIFSKFACSFLVGLINKKTWVEVARKPALASGVTVEALAELEKFIDTSKPADALWRGFHAYTQLDTSLEVINDTHDIDKYDFEFVCKQLEATQGRQYDFVAPPPTEAAKKPKRAKKKSEPKNKAKQLDSE